jgi:acyclic terpene utilization AtuA family protein
VSTPLRIANAQGFWGDQPDAAARLVAQAPDLDYLTLDYLAEVSLSIMAIQRQRDPEAGYARDFVDVVRSLVPYWQEGGKVRVVANAGGLNPEACAKACLRALREARCHGKHIALVTGDGVLDDLQTHAEAPHYANLETGAPATVVVDRLVTANAYLGAAPIVEALEQGADIVITGRTADPSLAVGPCMHHFGWSAGDYDRIAGATVAGHLIECGTQVTGGFSTEWLDLPDPANMGFPIVETDDSGACVVTKPTGTGGRVSVPTVKEQLLYEIGDPGDYLSPDARVSFLTLTVAEEGPDRVRVSGATGGAPPDTYKVSATYREGYTATGMLTIFGRNAVAKARKCGEVIIERVRKAGYDLAQHHIECLGAGDAVPGVLPAPELLETVLRVIVADPNKAAVERFAKEIAPLVTSGPQGVTGYATGRPRVRPVFGYWPCLVPCERVTPQVEVMTV